MGGFADELSLKLSAHGDMAERAREAKKDVTAAGKAMHEARKEFERTGAPEAEKQYRDLHAEYRRLLTVQADLQKSLQKTRKEFDAAKRSASESTSIASRVGRAWMKTASIFQNNVVAGLSAVGVALAGREALRQYGEAEAMQGRLEFSYKKFPRLADVNIEKMRELNTEIMNKTGADDDALSAAEANLALFKLTGTQVSRLIPLVNDYAIAMGTDVTDASTTIGKALMGNARAMKALGIDFKSTGNRGKDFEKILGLLERKVGGVGEAFGQTTQGGLAIANQNFGNLQETVGESLVPGLQALLGVVKPVSEFFQGLPSPLRTTVIAVVAVGVAALIVTSRVANMAAAAKLAGWSFAGLRSKAIGAAGALGIIGTAVGVFAIAQANANAKGQELADTLDEVTGKATELTRRKIGEEFLRNFSSEDLAQTPFTLREIVDAATEGGQAYKDLQDRVKAWADESRRGLQGLNPLHNSWVHALENSVTAAGRDANAMREVAEAEKAAGRAAAGATTHVDSLARANERASLATQGLDKALAGLDRHIAQREAVRSFREALTAFKKKPSEESGVALEAAMSSAAKTFKDPERRAKFVKGAIDDIRGAVNNTGLSSGIKTQLKAPLHDSYVEAVKLLGAMRQVHAIEAARAASAAMTPHGAAAAGYAAGGRIAGPGTGTSDSVPVWASAGEFMLTARTARAIGYGTLDAINRSGRLPSLPPAVNAPTIVIPAPERVGRDAPLIGTAYLEAGSQADLDLSLSRVAREQERRAEVDRRTRFAKAPR